jgi:hypothetical protein
MRGQEVFVMGASPQRLCSSASALAGHCLKSLAAIVVAVFSISKPGPRDEWKRFDEVDLTVLARKQNSASHSSALMPSRSGQNG